MPRFKPVKPSEERVGEETNNDIDIKVNSEIDILNRYIKKVQTDLSDLKYFFKDRERNREFITRDIDNIGNNLRRSMNKLYDISLYTGMKIDERQDLLFKVDLEFHQNGEHLHIVFPDLLPRRISDRSPVDREHIRRMYYPSFKEYFSNNGSVIYFQKAVIIYTHFFDSPDKMVDHENFETKVVTDILTSYLFKDDSPKHCAILMDYKIGEKSHTEVDVLPFKQMKDFLKEHSPTPKQA